MSDREGTRPGTARGLTALAPHRMPGGEEGPARAAVLILHGGRADSLAPSRPWHVSRLRMRPFVRSVLRSVPDPASCVAEVRYRVRGWNGSAADPLADVHRALAELTEMVGEVPVVLVGHSMGGRAALRAAAAPQVRSVVALAPWCPEGEPVAHLRDTRLVVLHGDRDRITDAAASFALVRRAAGEGSTARAVRVAGGDHAMLRRARTWHRVTASAVAALLPGADGADGVLPAAGPDGRPGVL